MRNTRRAFLEVVGYISQIARHEVRKRQPRVLARRVVLPLNEPLVAPPLLVAAVLDDRLDLPCALLRVRARLSKLIVVVEHASRVGGVAIFTIAVVVSRDTAGGGRTRLRPAMKRTNMRIYCLFIICLNNIIIIL